MAYSLQRIIKSTTLTTTIKHICPRLLGVNTSTCFYKRKNTFSSETAIPLPSDEKVYPEHIHDIVNQISKLTLLEVADLNELLKSTLKISDAPTMAMMPGMMAGGGQMAAKDEEDEEDSKPVISLFSVKLTAIDSSKKVALVKEIRSTLEGMNLVQAKKFVEALPQVVKKDLKKEEAEELKKKLETFGCTVELEDVV